MLPASGPKFSEACSCNCQPWAAGLEDALAPRHLLLWAAASLAHLGEGGYHAQDAVDSYEKGQSQPPSLDPFENIISKEGEYRAAGNTDLS